MDLEWALPDTNKMEWNGREYLWLQTIIVYAAGYPKHDTKKRISTKLLFTFIII